MSLSPGVHSAVLALVQRGLQAADLLGQFVEVHGVAAPLVPLQRGLRRGAVVALVQQATDGPLARASTVSARRSRSASRCSWT